MSNKNRTTIKNNGNSIGINGKVEVATYYGKPKKTVINAEILSNVINYVATLSHSFGYLKYVMISLIFAVFLPSYGITGIICKSVAIVIVAIMAIVTSAVWRQNKVIIDINGKGHNVTVKSNSKQHQRYKATLQGVIPNGVIDSTVAIDGGTISCSKESITIVGKVKSNLFGSIVTAKGKVEMSQSGVQSISCVKQIKYSGAMLLIAAVIMIMFTIYHADLLWGKEVVVPSDPSVNNPIELWILFFSSLYEAVAFGIVSSVVLLAFTIIKGRRFVFCAVYVVMNNGTIMKCSSKLSDFKILKEFCGKEQEILDKIKEQQLANADKANGVSHKINQ